MNTKFSSFGRRLLAMIVDSIILTSILNIFFLYSHSISPLIGMLVSFLYYILLYSFWNGQTIGKHLLSIRVAKINGKPMSGGTAIIRTLGYYISAIPFCIGFLWSIWDKNKQTWHDKIAKTYVVRTEDAPKKLLCAILLIIAIILGIWSFLSKTINSFSTGNNAMTIDGQETQLANNVSSIRSALNLNYIKYDGSGDAAIIKKFNNPALKDVSSGTQQMGENAVEVGDGNINIAGGDTITLDHKSDVFIKLTTDTEAAAFIFTKDSLDKFMKTEERQKNPFGVKQDPKDFIPLYALKSSYSELSLEAGTYELVIIPTEKAINISSAIKVK